MTQDVIAKAEAALKNQDPKLGALITRQTLSPSERPTDYFAALCRSIIGQQVSVAAASAIYSRFEEITNLLPNRTLSITEEEIKIIGLSKQKTLYIKDLAQKFHDNPDVYEHLERQTDEQVIDELIKVKGIGAWTAQMFLMFTLQRPDVFAPDDVGLQRAMMQLYDWDELPKKNDLETVAEAWKPYRTIASLHLWQSLNNTPG